MIILVMSAEIMDFKVPGKGSGNWAGTESEPGAENEMDARTELDTDGFTDNSAADESNTTSPVQTADNTPIGRYLGWMLIALILMLAVGIRKYGNRSERRG